MRPARPLAIVLTLLLACGVVACRGEKPATPTTASAMRSKDQAMAMLMALPELKERSAQIEKNSGGKTHPALMEDEQQTVGGRKYWQLTFAENSPEAARRMETFLVPESGDDILVRDFENNRNLTIAQWRAAQPVSPVR